MREVIRSTEVETRSSEHHDQVDTARPARQKAFLECETGIMVCVLQANSAVKVELEYLQTTQGRELESMHSPNVTGSKPLVGEKSSG